MPSGQGCSGLLYAFGVKAGTGFASALLPGASCGSGSAANRPQVLRNLDRAIKFIHERYGEDIGLAQMAKAAGLSPNYFCQLFADYAGCAPRKYLNAVRLQEAKRLIEEGSLNFTQIAARCGFGSIHSFSKVFRRLEGKSPSDCKAGL